MSCLPEDQLLLLADGGIPPNERPPLDQHLAGCASCRSNLEEIERTLRALGPQDENVDVDAHVASILGRLKKTDESDLAQRDPKSPDAMSEGKLSVSKLDRRWWAAGAATAVAIAAGAWLLVHPAKEGTVAARGGVTASSLAHDVGVHLYVGETSLAPVTRGMTVDATTPFVAGYTHLGSEPAHLLLFAIDSDGETHWLYPSYESPEQHPVSMPLVPSQRESLFPTSVELDHPSRGGLHVVALVTKSAVPVSAIEGNSRAELSDEALQRRFPGASLETFDLVVEPAKD